MARPTDPLALPDVTSGVDPSTLPAYTDFSSSFSIDPATVAAFAGPAVNFLGGYLGSNNQAELTREQLAQQRELALRNEQFQREQLQQQWEMGQQELAARQLTQEEQSKQFAHDRAQQAAQFEAGTMGDVLGQRQQDALSRDKLGLEATQMDPLAQQKSRQKNAVMAALMGGAAPYSITPSADVFGPQGMPQLRGGLQIPEGGFDAETMAFFSPEARAGAEGQFANAVASVNPSLPTPDLSALGYGAAGTAPSQASDAFRSLQETELQSAQQEHLNSVLSALGSGGSSPTFTPMSSATAPQASDTVGSPTTPESFIGEAGDPKLPGPAPGSAESRYAPRTAPDGIWNGVRWGGSERAMKDEPIPPETSGLGGGGGGIDPIAAYNAIKALLGKGKNKEADEDVPAQNGSIVNAGRGRR